MGAESTAEAEAPVVVVEVVREQATPQCSDQEAPVLEVLTDENANSVPTTPESSTDSLNLQAAPAGVAVVDLTQEDGATAANPIHLDADRQEEPAQRPSVASIPIKQGTSSQPGSSSQPGTPPR